MQTKKNHQTKSNKLKEGRRKINLHSNNTESYNQPFTMTELKTSLRKSHNTTPGRDEIPYEFLKQLPNIYSKSSTTFGTVGTSLIPGNKLL